MLVEYCLKRVGKGVLLTLVLKCAWSCYTQIPYLFHTFAVLYICHTFYFRLVLFPVYVCDFMQMYLVRNDEINMFNQSVIITEYLKLRYFCSGAPGIHTAFPSSNQLYAVALHIDDMLDMLHLYIVIVCDAWQAWIYLSCVAQMLSQ